jgi:hypothetical protein
VPFSPLLPSLVARLLFSGRKKGGETKEDKRFRVIVQGKALNVTSSHQPSTSHALFSLNHTIHISIFRLGCSTLPIDWIDTIDPQLPAPQVPPSLHHPRPFMHLLPSEQPIHLGRAVEAIFFPHPPSIIHSPPLSHFFLSSKDILFSISDTCE